MHLFLFLFFDRANTHLYRKPILTVAAEKQKKDRTKKTDTHKGAGESSLQESSKTNK
jgi:hypothetical protein